MFRFNRSITASWNLNRLNVFTCGGYNNVSEARQLLQLRLRRASVGDGHRGITWRVKEGEQRSLDVSLVRFLTHKCW